MNRRKYILSLVSILFITLLLVSGSTFAYLSWISSDNTLINIAVSEKINMIIDPDSGDGFTGLKPTMDYTFDSNTGKSSKGDGVVHSSARITIENQTGVKVRPAFKLKVKITDRNGNIITNETSYMDANDNDSSTNNPYRYYIKYAVTKNGDNGMIYASGRFDENIQTKPGSNDGWYDSDYITTINSAGFPNLIGNENEGVSFEVGPYVVDRDAGHMNTQTYRVYFWIDGNYTTKNTGDEVGGDLLQDAIIHVSWSDNSTVKQVSSSVLSGDAYALYLYGGKLWFVRSDTPVTEDSYFADSKVMKVYSNFENTRYTSTSKPPWVNDAFDSIHMYDVVAPISTAYWFSNLSRIISISLDKLDTSSVDDMSYMFSSSGGATVMSVDGIDTFDTSNVENMEGMFDGFGRTATAIIFSDISNWNTSNVENMNYMFRNMAPNITWSLDLSRWNVCKVTAYTGFDTNVTNKITAPNFGMSCST